MKCCLFLTFYSHFTGKIETFQHKPASGLIMFNVRATNQKSGYVNYAVEVSGEKRELHQIFFLGSLMKIELKRLKDFN